MSETPAPTNDKAHDQEKAEKIMQQVEYYFGDINLPRDKFLLNEIKANGGWIPLTTMLKFNRLAQISTDVDELAAALKDSNMIEVNQTNNSIRRSIEHPLPDNTLEYWLEVKRCTVYLKGFPQGATISEILAFMHKQGDVVNVLMRKTKTGDPRVFKGSIFATFKTKEEAEAFVNNEEPVVYDGVELKKLMQEAYWTNKHKEIKERKQAQKLLKQAKREQVEKEQKEGIAAAHFVKGIVLKVQGIPSECTVNELKDYFGNYGNVAYIKLASETEPDTYVRFNSTEENAAQTSWDKAVEAGTDGKATYEKDGTKHELAGQVLEGDEESQYWVEFNNQKLKAAERTSGRGRRNRHQKDQSQNKRVNRRKLFNEDGEEIVEDADLPEKKPKIDGEGADENGDSQSVNS